MPGAVSPRGFRVYDELLVLNGPTTVRRWWSFCDQVRKYRRLGADVATVTRHPPTYPLGLGISLAHERIERLRASLGKLSKSAIQSVAPAIGRSRQSGRRLKHLKADIPSTVCLLPTGRAFANMCCAR